MIFLEKPLQQKEKPLGNKLTTKILEKIKVPRSKKNTMIEFQNYHQNNNETGLAERLNPVF